MGQEFQTDFMSVVGTWQSRPTLRINLLPSPCQSPTANGGGAIRWPGLLMLTAT